MPSKRLKRNEFGSLILEEIEEEEIENSSLEVKFEKKNDANAKVKEEESILEYAFDCKQNMNG